MALDFSSGQEPTFRLLDLPIELRECIYEHYLALLKPSTFSAMRNMERTTWVLVTKARRHTPVLLLVSRTVAAEFKKVMSMKTASGPIDGMPLSSGPNIVLEYGWDFGGAVNYDGECVIKHENMPEILAPILTSAPSMRLLVILPHSQVDVHSFICMLRVISAICITRSHPLMYIRAVRYPLSGPRGFDDVKAEINMIPCERLEWENWYWQWHQSRSATARAEHSPSDGRMQLSIEQAWQNALDSMKDLVDRYSPGMS